MFEDSLFSSAPVRGAGRLRWFVAASVATQALLVAVVLVAPMLWPAVLPVVAAAPLVSRVSLNKPQPKPQPLKPIEVRATNTTAVHAPAAQPQSVATLRSGGTIARPGTPATSEIAPGLGLTGDMARGTNALPGFGPGTDGGGPVVRAAAPAVPHSPTALRISSGVSTGLLLQPIRPVYPAIAKASHTEGIVTLTATIDKAGRIVNLQVVSGPLMLRGAALEAVESARYRPFLLNGVTTEVVTTISIVFSISG